MDWRGFAQFFRMRPKVYVRGVWLALAMLVSVAGCSPSSKTVTIGVVNYLGVLQPAFDGLKAGLAEQGYREGQDIRYLYNGVSGPDRSGVEAEVSSLIDQGVDALFTMGHLPTAAAKRLGEAKGVPVVFSPMIDPVGQGFVASLARPGGHVTGVHNANRSAKSVEWMRWIFPNTRKVHIFYSKDDSVSTDIVTSLLALGNDFGLRIVPEPVRSAQEAKAGVARFSAGAALLVIPTPSLKSLEEVQILALQRGIPVGTYNMPPDNALFSYSVDWFKQGKQAARLLDRILKGAKPAELPVEAAESFLTLNLAVAAKYGFEVSDQFLSQADNILR